MKNRPLWLAVRVLAIAVFSSCAAMLFSEQSQQATCQTCVHLDPGSAIIYGCEDVADAGPGTTGSTYCFPTDVGCNTGGAFCYVDDPAHLECLSMPWDAYCQSLCWDEPFNIWCRYA